MSKFNDLFYQSTDGLRLYARDYPCQDEDIIQPEIIFCMHGLTRNSADFDKLAKHLSQHYRVISVDNRGRGESAYDNNPANYIPLTYVADMFTLLDLLDFQKVILCGTSMGGIMAFIMAAMQPQRIRGLIINDVGPELETKGIKRIASYVGKTSQVKSWADATAITKAINKSAFPNFTDEEWEDFARNIFKDDNGKLRLNYDPGIAIPFKDMDTGSAAPDLWPQFEAIVSIPMLLIRGANSDLISSACVEKMFKRKPDMRFAEIPETGHAPTLNEPLSRAAIDAFLFEL